MGTSAEHGGSAHDGTHAPMVEEITDFEVLEIALRELAIEKGLFTAEDHRHYTEWVEQMGPAPPPGWWPGRGSTRPSRSWR
ncbi:hypothetical protein [Streptacidiphilus rugosus]|uniref:hypothetical protein n=1 Tax=Streptacidiphilus rugosus TaxID=405783 RepID=UPI0018DE4C3D|nr:hypothetical protein [Streptacidiphilus rugosus]